MGKINMAVSKCQNLIHLAPKASTYSTLNLLGPCHPNRHDTKPQRYTRLDLDINKTLCECIFGRGRTTGMIL